MSEVEDDLTVVGARREGCARPRRLVWPFAVVLVLAFAWVGVRPAAAQSLTPMGQPVPRELLARAFSLDTGARLGAIGPLRDLGTPAAFAVVVMMLQRDYDARVRWSAALALGASHDPAVEGPLAYAARYDADPAVRDAAARARAAVLPFDRRPKLAAGLSLLCPGCGYFYLHEPERAIGYLFGAAALVAGGVVIIENSPVDPVSGSHTDGRGTPLLMAAQNLWFYGVYATYRDVRLARGDVGYKYPVAREHLDDLLLAPFNPQVLKKPWVWAGIPLGLGAAVAFSYLAGKVLGQSTTSMTRTLGDPGGVRFFGRQYSTGTGFALGSAYNLSIFLPVGAGEEALFRGAIQAGLSETSLDLWGGWALASVIFGGAHLVNFVGASDGARTAALAIPYLMASGGYLGLVYIRTGFSLKAGAAVHFWYDFLLSTIDFVADPDHQPFVMRFGMPF
jgi:hypothetical protein